MAAPTTNLLLTDQDNGANDNTWGDVVDANFEIIDAKTGDMTTIATTSGTVTLSTSQERVNVVKCTGALVGALTLVFSGRGGSWIIWNATSGAYTVTAKVSGQTGVEVDQDSKKLVFCDATDIRDVAVDLSDALSAISALTPAADRLPYYTSASAAALATFTSFGRTLVDDADAATARSTLGLVIGTNVQAYDADLTTLGAGGSGARSFLGLGSLATASTINGGDWSGTDLALGDGGTGISAGSLFALTDSLLDSLGSETNGAMIYCGSGGWAIMAPP